MDEPEAHLHPPLLSAFSVDEVAAKFDNELGSEGRALISNLIAARNAREDH